MFNYDHVVKFDKQISNEYCPNRIQTKWDVSTIITEKVQ